MDERISRRYAESATHNRLKRLAFTWAQTQGYSACAMEIRLPKSRYRGDVVAYCPEPKSLGSTAIFECKQALPDLRRDNCDIAATRVRLEAVAHRRAVLEKHFRIHFPTLRIADSLFPEYDSHDFGAIQHQGYARVLRELSALQNRLSDCTKFENLIRYRCANLFFLVMPRHLYRDSEIPIGWGALVESDGELELARKPAWQETSFEIRLQLLHRIAVAGTRILNRQLKINFDNQVAFPGTAEDASSHESVFKKS